MEDNQQMVMTILQKLRAEPNLWPKEVPAETSGKYLDIIEELTKPNLNARGYTISTEDFTKTKEWCNLVLENYIKNNPFQGAFIKPYAGKVVETLDRMWKRREEASES